MRAKLAGVAQQGYSAAVLGPAQGDDRVWFRRLSRFVDEQETKTRSPIWIGLFAPLAKVVRPGCSAHHDRRDAIE